MYQDGASYGVIVICPKMGMIPVEPVLILEGETVSEVPAGQYGILRYVRAIHPNQLLDIPDSRRAFHPYMAYLVEKHLGMSVSLGLLSSEVLPAMPVQTALNMEVVLDQDLDIVAFVNFDQWSRLMTINQIDLACKAI